MSVDCGGAGYESFKAPSKRIFECLRMKAKRGFTIHHSSLQENLIR